jgi:hypothetical protein
MEDDDRSFWLYMPCSLVRIARPEFDAWVADPKRTIQFTVFNSSDGVRSHTTPPTYTLNGAKSTDGKIWFPPVGGVCIIDPHRHLPFNKLPPPVHVEQVIADRKMYWQNSSGVAILFAPEAASAGSRFGVRLYRAQPGGAGEGAVFA